MMSNDADAGSLCCTHDVFYALGDTPDNPPAAVGAGAGAGSASGPTKPKAPPKKCTLKWPESKPPTEPAAMSCAGCNTVADLYDTVAAAAAPETLQQWRDKLCVCRARTMAYMGHMLRCCVQQHYISLLIQSVVANPRHAHIVVDYKV